MVFPVSVPDHEKLILQVHLVHVFEICIGFDIGAAVGGDNGYPGQTAAFVVNLGIILFQEKRGRRLLSCFPSTIIRNPPPEDLLQSSPDLLILEKGLFFPGRWAGLFIQDDLPDLPAVKGRQQIGRVGGKDYLAFLESRVQDLAGGFLKLGWRKISGSSIRRMEGSRPSSSI